MLRYNKICLFLGICWLIFEQGFYLLPSQIGGIYLQDIAIALMIVYELSFYLKNREIIRYRNDKFEFLSFSFLILIIIAAIMAKLHWNQGPIASILPQRYLIAIFLMYYPIKQALVTGRVSEHQLTRLLLFLGKTELIVMMLQFVLQFAGVYFLTCQYNNRMYVFTRFGVDGTIILFTVFYEISRLFATNKGRIKSFIWILMGAVFFFLMFQTRMTLLGICVALLVFYLTLKTNKRKKVVITLVFMLVAFAIYNTSLFQDTINIRDTGARNTMDIRQQAISFYLTDMMNYPLFGAGGYPNSEAANIARNRYEGFGLNDNGIFAIAYMHGLVGVIWVLYMYILMLNKGNKTKNIKNNSAFLMFPVYLIAVSATELHWYWVRSVVLVLVIFWAVIQ